MMGIEQPAIAAVIARLPEIKENLAAFGLTFALSLIIEAPIIQLLSAANVLAKDRQSYARLLVFTHIAGWSLSLLHLFIALTPLFDLIVCRIIHAPSEIVETTRSAFLIMTPWTVAIAYRRLGQGILIGYGHTSIIPLTMTSRLVAITVTLGIGVFFPVLPGACLGALALSCGVISGAIVTYFFARKVVAREIPATTGITLSWSRLLGFYMPLALTSMIGLAVQPVMSIGLARMDHPLESLAVWPVLMGFTALFQSPCFSYQEAVVALLPRQGGYAGLKRFTRILSITLTLCFFAAAMSQPLRWLWFGWISGLSEHLLSLVHSPLMVLALVPFLTIAIAWYRGILVSNRHTTAVTYAVVLSGSVLVGSMFTLPLVVNLPGVVVVALCLVLSLCAETGFLKFCVAREAMH
jgi:Na+-driven multidrug efflux pump